MKQIKITEIWDKTTVVNNNTLVKELLLMQKISILSSRITRVFGTDEKQASRIFAFVESKYSSKIEGIYTTLFDVVNTGYQTGQHKIIAPIVDELFRTNHVPSIEKLSELNKIINSTKDNSKRWTDEFGIYKTNKEGVSNKIYEPSKDKDFVDILLKRIDSKSKDDKTINEILHTHILFEKIHPFVDANGRLGRLLLQKQLIVISNLSNVVPMSWSFFKNLSKYYSMFDIYKKDDIESSILTGIEIIEYMVDHTILFLDELKQFVDKHISFVKGISSSSSYELAFDILTTLQTKKADLIRKYKLNDRTIDSIFNKLNSELAFNRKRVGKEIVYWNIELEDLIEKHFQS